MFSANNNPNVFRRLNSYKRNILKKKKKNAGAITKIEIPNAKNVLD